MRLTGGYDYGSSSTRSKVLEYQPEPSNQWTTVGQLKIGRTAHAALSFGSEALPCLQGASETTTTQNTTKATTTATTTTSDQNQSTEPGSTGVLEVALPIGILLLVIIIVAIGCAICKQRKRPEKKQEVMNADENAVYEVHQLSETYE